MRGSSDVWWAAFQRAVITTLIVAALMSAVARILLPRWLDLYPPPASALPGTIVGLLVWVMAIAAGALVAWLTLRRNRKKQGARCVQCGYNLTGNVSGVCPECGRAFDKDVDHEGQV